VFFFSAVDGVEPQSETNWRLADQYNKFPYWFVNKMDRQGSELLDGLSKQRYSDQTLLHHFNGEMISKVL
jgi:translation elongation factor EF-G